MNATVSVMLCALAAMVKILIVSIVGIVATKFPKEDPLLPPHALRYISRMCNVVLLPCLIMGSLGLGIKPAFMSRIYILIGSCLIINLVSYFLAYFAGKLYRLDGIDRALYLAIIVGIGSPNAVSLPIMVMQTLCEKDVVNEDYGGSYSGCYTEAVSMLFIYSIGWHLMFWSFGFPVLKSIKPIEDGTGPSAAALNAKSETNNSLEGRCRHLLKWLKDVLVTPAMIGTILGIIIGFTRPLKVMLFETISILEPLGSAIITLGEPVVCLNCLVMAASLANGTNLLKTKPKVQSATTPRVTNTASVNGGDTTRSKASDEESDNNNCRYKDFSSRSLLSATSNTSLPGGKDAIGLFPYSGNFGRHHHTKHSRAYHSHHHSTNNRFHPLVSRILSKLPHSHRHSRRHFALGTEESMSSHGLAAHDESALLADSSSHGGRAQSSSPFSVLTNHSSGPMAATVPTPVDMTGTTTNACDNGRAISADVVDAATDVAAAPGGGGGQSSRRSQKLMGELNQHQLKLKQQFEQQVLSNGNDSNTENNNNSAAATAADPFANEEHKSSSDLLHCEASTIATAGGGGVANLSNSKPSSLMPLSHIKTSTSFMSDVTTDGFHHDHGQKGENDDNSTINPLLGASMSSQELHLVTGQLQDRKDGSGNGATEIDTDASDEPPERSLPSWAAIGIFVLCRMLFAPAIIVLVILPAAIKMGIVPVSEHMMRLVICIESASSSAQIVIVSLNQIGVPRIASTMAYMYMYQYGFGIFAITLWVTIAMGTIYQP